MAEDSKAKKFKYGLLKLIDVSGFKVFDPVVRLFYREEPQKQLRDITRYMVLPMRPAGTESLSQAELEALVTRDSMIGVARLPDVEG